MELSTILRASGQSDDSNSLHSLYSLISLLRSASSSTAPDTDTDYTTSRAYALRSLATKLQEMLLSSRGTGTTYADRAKALAVVSDSYLKLAHAFKTDPKMWALAQSELVPSLIQVVDEDSIDHAVSVLESHLETYLISLNLWIER